MRLRFRVEMINDNGERVPMPIEIETEELQQLPHIP